MRVNQRPEYLEVNMHQSPCVEREVSEQGEVGVGVGVGKAELAPENVRF